MNRTTKDLPAARKASAEAQAKVKAENAKHTPGPWVVRTIDQSLATVETQDGRYIIGNAGQLRADDWRTDHIERKANARLIAAAPELLDALVDLLEADVYADGEGLVYIKHSDTDDGEKAVAKARAAIAKAQGAPHE